MFCAGANIRMLGKSTHQQKVNFCKFTNETRLAIEDASREFQADLHLRAINGNCAGGGYELALAADHIMLVDDRRSAVSLPETPLLGGAARHRRAHPRHRQAQGAARPRRRVLLDRGGHARRQGGRMAAGRRGGAELEMERRGGGARARNRRALRPARRTPRASSSTPLARKIDGDRVSYSHVDVEIDRDARARDRHRARAVAEPCRPRSKPRMRSATSFWPLAVARELEDAILHLRANERDDRRRAVAHRRQCARPCWSTTTSSPRRAATG